MRVWQTIKAAFAPGAAVPPDARRLNAVDVFALSASLEALLAEERGWITLSEARALFSPMRSVRWTKLGEPSSPLLQRRASICAISILCPSRGGSILPEKQLDTRLCQHRAEPPQPGAGTRLHPCSLGFSKRRTEPGSPGSSSQRPLG